jgi:hypothetical protein
MTGALTMGNVVIPKQAPRPEAWWATFPREGFSAECRKRFGEFITPDEMSDSLMAIYLRRADLLSAVNGVRRAKANRAIRRVSVVSNN